jgi:hypothetical protein
MVRPPVVPCTADSHPESESVTYGDSVALAITDSFAYPITYRDPNKPATLAYSDSLSISRAESYTDA